MSITVLETFRDHWPYLIYSRIACTSAVISARTSQKQKQNLIHLPDITFSRFSLSLPFSLKTSNESWAHFTPHKSELWQWRGETDQWFLRNSSHILYRWTRWRERQWKVWEQHFIYIYICALHLSLICFLIELQKNIFDCTLHNLIELVVNTMWLI